MFVGFGIASILKIFKTFCIVTYVRKKMTTTITHVKKANIDNLEENKENVTDLTSQKKSIDLINNQETSLLRSINRQPKVTLVDVKLGKKEHCLKLGKDLGSNCLQSTETSAKSDEIMTESMLAEEQELHDTNEKKSEELKKLAIKKWQEVSLDVRLSQLNHLLEKSSIYANYLLNVIEVSRKKEEKKAMKKKKLSSKDNVKVSSKSEAKKRKQIDSSSRKKKKLDKNFEKESFYQLGDKVKFEINENSEEELVEGKVIDKVFENKSWKYQVKCGRSKIWINESAIFKDLSENCDDEKSTINISIRKVSPTNNIDQASLLENKLYTGSSIIENNPGCFNGETVPTSQPDYLTGGILRDYQITGYQWLKVLFDNAVNGILADEMGLGKTIQCIAMICRLIKTGFQGPFLVCAPLSTICNWILEFKKFAPQIPLLLYHGSAPERTLLSKWIGKSVSALECRPVVVTSYEVLMKDRPVLAKYSWDYLIVDEGHRLKNINCRLLKELKALTVTAKVLLTGTPLQNNLGELWSLLNFLLPEVFNDLNTFEAWFDLNEIQKEAKAISSKKEEDIVVTLHKILAPFLLRRTKGDIDLKLPPKRELLVFVPLVASQASFYQAIANRTIRKVLYKEEGNEQSLDLTKLCDPSNEFLPENLSGKLTRSSTLSARLTMEKQNLFNDDSVINVSLNNLMMQMRKCCNHPYLIKFPLIPGTDFYRIDNEIVTSCGKMQLLDRMLPVLFKNNHKVLIFSQMTKILDILEDYCRFKAFRYFRLDGSTKCDDRQMYIDQFNNDSAAFIFLLSTKAGGLGINLAAADTVIIYDSDWNPQNDLQAQDRCHRIGQTRPVIVYRLVAANTVDQFMVQRAEAKRVLEHLIINRSKFKGKLDEDLKSDASNGVESTTLLSMLQKFRADADRNTSPISEEELGKILDREYVMKCTDDDLSCGVFQNIE